MTVSLRRAAEADVRAAVAYYAAAGPDLGEQFIEELGRLLSRLAVFPRSAQQVQGFAAVRRPLVRRFPFAVYYVERVEGVVVLRVVHTARSMDDDSIED